MADVDTAEFDVEDVVLLVGTETVADFVAGADSPVSTASSHSKRVVVMSRKSAGTIVPTDSSTTSPGTRSATLTGAGWPLRQATTWCRMLECNAMAANSDRYSLEKPSPTLNSEMVAIMTESVASPVTADTAAAPPRRISSGLRS